MQLQKRVCPSVGLTFCPSVTRGIVVVVPPVFVVAVEIFVVIVIVLIIRWETGLCDRYDKEWRHQNRNSIHLVEITTFLTVDENIRQKNGQIDERDWGIWDSIKIILWCYLSKNIVLPTVGGMGGVADKFRWMGGGTDRQTDKETGIGTNQDGPTDPPKAMGWRIKTILWNYFTNWNLRLQGMQLTTDSSVPSMYQLTLTMGLMTSRAQ